MEDGLSERARVTDTLRQVGLGLREAPAEDGSPQFVVDGDTYSHRELIKRMGGRWSGRDRVWLLRFDGVPARPGLAEAPAGFENRPQPHYLGHRDRLRTRFETTAEPSALADYELLELLLFFSIHRRDTKPMAKEMLARFGGLGGVIAAEPGRFAECVALAPVTGDLAGTRDDDLRFTRILLKAIHALLQRVLKEEIKDRPVISSWTALIDYLRLAMTHEPTEHFRILFLDRKNILIRDEVQSRGTVDHTPLYPREVVKRALELSASAIIMVHNHPSGDPTPSEADIEMTRQVIAALQGVDIAVHDHVIIGKNKHTSFKSSRLI
jgi:DNA repair protein RadC